MGKETIIVLLFIMEPACLDAPDSGEFSRFISRCKWIFYYVNYLRSVLIDEIMLPRIEV